MATNKQMREAILGKLVSLLSKGKKPSKSVEKKIKSDPKLKALWDKAEEASAELKKTGEELDDLLGL